MQPPNLAPTGIIADGVTNYREGQHAENKKRHPQTDSDELLHHDQDHSCDSKKHHRHGAGAADKVGGSFAAL
jgi:hypothetical protein